MTRRKYLFVRRQPNVRLGIQAVSHVYITLYTTLVEQSTALAVWNSERALKRSITHRLRANAFIIREFGY